MTRKEWIFLSFSCASLALLVTFYFYNFLSFFSGLSYLKKENYKEAQKEFLNVLSQKPFLYPAHLNLGLTYTLMKDFKNSLGEYRVVFEESPHKMERFQAYFNSAYLKTLTGDLKSALHYYQQALSENPNSMEVKKNIELLLKSSNQTQSSDSKKDQEKEQNQDFQSGEDQKDSSKGSPQNTEEQGSKKNNKENINETEEVSKTQKYLNAEQMKWILEELENREQKLRTRLQESQKNRKGKSW